MKLPTHRKVGGHNLSPGRAQKILDADHDCTCMYGHWYCAISDGGLCSNEVASEFYDDPRVFTDMEGDEQIEEDEFCHVCGQIGCAHDGRER